MTLAGLAGAGAIGCAAPTDAPAKDEVRVDAETGAVRPRIFGGDRDDDGGSMPGVVALRVGEGGTFELCTGALLSPNVVLTARHCVTKNLTTSVACDENGNSANGAHTAGVQDPSIIAVFVGVSPSFGQTPAAFAKAVVSPETDYLCDKDIALVVLERDLSGIEPLAVRLGRDRRPAKAGETIRAVGYGQNDEEAPIGTRFRKENVEVLAVGRAISKSKTPLGAHEFEVTRSICQGDSGGPAISETTGAVIGVVSRGGSCDEDFGHIYTTTSGFEDLFDAAFAEAGGGPIPEGATAPPPVPEDGEGPAEEADRASTNAPEPAAKGCTVAPTRKATSGPAMAMAAGAMLVLGARRRRARVTRRTR